MTDDALRARIAHYILGGACALLLTSGSFVLVAAGGTHTGLIAAGLLFLALLQMAVQLYFFLHLSEEKKPRWKSVSLLFTIGVVLIVVCGSIWVMTHLNYNMGMSPEQMKEHIIKENKKGF